MYHLLCCIRGTDLPPYTNRAFLEHPLTIIFVDFLSYMLHWFFKNCKTMNGTRRCHAWPNQKLKNHQTLSSPLFIPLLDITVILAIVYLSKAAIMYFSKPYKLIASKPHFESTTKGPWNWPNHALISNCITCITYLYPAALLG